MLSLSDLEATHYTSTELILRLINNLERRNDKTFQIILFLATYMQ